MKDQKTNNVKKGRLLKKTAGMFLSGLMAVSPLVSSLPMTTITAKAASTEFETVTDANLAKGTIYNTENLPKLNTNAKTKYWFAGNAFYGLARSGREFGESYSNNTWLLEDTDAMWDGNYLYSTWGSASATSDCYTVWGATDNQEKSGSYYYQKILTYGERLWNTYKSQWFNSAEIEANNEYRTYEKYIAGATTSGSNYNYWLGAATAANLAANNYTITEVKKWYETGNTDTTKYLTLSASAAATTLDNTADGKIKGAGISSSSLSVKASNIYTIEGAHLYAPSYNEFTQNESVYKAIISNVYNDYKAVSSKSGLDYIRTSGGTTTEAIDGTHVYDRTRTDLWSRSFSGLHVGSTNFGAWGVGCGGNLYSGGSLTSSGAVAPAFNLDLSKVVMARSAKVGTSVTANSSLASYNPGDLNSASDVKFVLENSGLKLTADINGKALNNVVPGQTYTINYSGATTSAVNDKGIGGRAISGTKLFISAAIYNSDDEMVYYGPLASVSAASGAVDITIPEDLNGDSAYKLAIFEEQISGTYNISTPSGKTITVIILEATPYGSTPNDITSDPSGYTSSIWTWSGDAASVTLSRPNDASSYITISTITVVLAAKVSISDAKYATFCDNVARNFSGSGISVYTAASDGSKVVLSEIADGIVPENTGVVLYSDTKKTNVSIPATAASGSGDYTSNEMVGINVTTNVAADGGSGKTNYILSNEASGVGFYKATDSGANLGAHKAYLSTTNAASARDFLGFEENTTAIESITNSKEVKGEYFNLNGQRVAQPTKGLYIVNGKKVIK